MLIVDKPMPTNCYDCALDCCWEEGTIPAEYAEKRKLNCPIKGELARCGECKHFVENTWECSRLCDRFGDEYSDARVYPDWFCADGERKDGERDV